MRDTSGVSGASGVQVVTFGQGGDLGTGDPSASAQGGLSTARVPKCEGPGPPSSPNHEEGCERGGIAFSIWEMSPFLHAAMSIFPFSVILTE